LEAAEKEGSSRDALRRSDEDFAREIEDDSKEMILGLSF
jgi:hypothetical protein